MNRLSVDDSSFSLKEILLDDEKTDKFITELNQNERKIFSILFEKYPNLNENDKRIVNKQINIIIESGNISE